MADDPDGALDRRIEVARQSGVPAAALELYERSRRGANTGIARTVAPDREIVAGVEVETDLGSWRVYETPGHAPSHVVLHQPESGLLISGDHVLGRVSPFFDYGHTPDPVGEFMRSLDVVERLDTSLCLAGHGRPFRDVPAKAHANRELIEAHLESARVAFAEGPRTAFQIIGDIVGPEKVTPATAAYGLQMALAYLDHLVAAGELVELAGEDPRRWALRR